MHLESVILEFFPLSNEPKIIFKSTWKTIRFLSTLHKKASFYESVLLKLQTTIPSLQPPLWLSSFKNKYSPNSLNDAMITATAP
jgi:hypothetical protein